MNSVETTMVLAVLQAAYPAFYRGFSKEELRNVANLWAEMFSEDNFREVMAATQTLIATKIESTPPTIGAVKEHLRKNREPNELSEQEAWRLVSKACQNGYYNSEEEFKKLPEIVQQSIGGPEQLRAWSQMDSETVESVVASNFMRTCKVKRQRQRELNMLPTDVRNFITSVSDKMKLDGAEQKRLEQKKPIAIEAPKLEKLGAPTENVPLPLPDFVEVKPYKVPPSEEWAKMRDKRLEALEAMIADKKAGEA